MHYHNKYLKEAGFLIPQSAETEGSVAWQSPSNIALIKYWGKKDFQLPANPSLSLTLSNAVTRTKVGYNYRPERKGLELKFYFHNKPENEFGTRIQSYLKQISDYLPFLSKLKLEIHSENTFPHSSGIASSASAFSSLALCLLDISGKLCQLSTSEADILRKASFLARLGSGSAARSIYPGFVLWGKTESISDSSDELSIPVNEQIHSSFRNLYDIILIIDKDPKKISSSKGHTLMNENPFSRQRYHQASINLMKILSSMKEGEINYFLELAEYEALSIHAMMLTSYPGYFLLKPKTLTVIEKIRQFRNDNNIQLGFTLDAGANVHMLFPASMYNQVIEFTDSEIKEYCLDQQYIIDQTGSAPSRISPQ
jgi:diphosphomevalonate decarboxylase